VCLRGCLWRFGGVVAGVLGKCGACGVCSRLLEMADFRVPPASRGNLKEGASIALVFVNCVPVIGLPQASAACVDIAARVQEDIDSARFVASLPPRLRAAVELRLNQSVIAEWGASAASATAATARG